MRVRRALNAARVGALFAAVVGVCIVPRLTRASECGRNERPWVRVEFAENTWSAALRERTFQDLRAGLANRQIEACLDASTETKPVALIRLNSGGADDVQVVVEVQDAVTSKRVSRTVNLANVPADGRAFAVALAADELLWASWAEVALERSRPQKEAKSAPAPPPPPQVVRGVERQLPREPSTLRVGARAAGEYFGGGQTQLGVDAVFLPQLGRRFQLELAGGVRRGLSVNAEHGVVRSNAAGISLGLGYRLIAAQRAEFGLGVSLRAAYVQFVGEAEPQASDDTYSGVAAFARSGLFGAFNAAGPLWLAVSAGAGAPLRALEVRDAGRVVSGMSGLELFGSFAVTGAL